jgi:hypothetical protein
MGSVGEVDCGRVASSVVTRYRYRYPLTAPAAGDYIPSLLNSLTLFLRA